MAAMICCYALLLVASSLSESMALSPDASHSMVMESSAGVGVADIKEVELRMQQKNRSTRFLHRNNEKCESENLMAYVAAHSEEWKTYGFEGGTNDAEFIAEQTMVKEVGAKTVCETGFNAGVSSLAWLCASPDITVHSFDIGHHDYVPIARDYLKEHFGKHRLNLTIGDSTVTLPTAIKAKNIRCDVAFVDGGHTFEVAFADIKNFGKLTVPKGRLLMENCNAQGKVRGYGGIQPVNEAYQEALKQGIIKHERQFSTAGCQSLHDREISTKCREICVGSYL